MNAYLQRVRLLSALLFFIAAVDVGVVVAVLGIGYVVLPGVGAVIALAVGSALIIPVVPWQRHHPNWFLVVGFSAVGLVTLNMLFTGGLASPFGPFMVFVIVLSGAYYSARPLALVTAWSILASAAAYFWSGGAAAWPRLLVDVPVYVLTAGVTNIIFRHLQQAALTAESAVEELRTTYQQTLESLALALDLHDSHSSEHSARAAHNAEAIAREMALPERDIQLLGQAALLHDIGKIGIPDAILLKPGRLTAAERTTIEQHPLLGHEMMRNIPFLQDAAQLVLYHHERCNGSGYPEGLREVQIPLGARIFAVVDVFDALSCHRPYHEPMHVDDALAYIERQSGSQFDPAVVTAFQAVLARGEILVEKRGVQAPAAEHPVLPEPGSEPASVRRSA